MSDLAALLQPLAPDDPCGEDLAWSGAFDAITRAREQDDPGLAQGAWVAPLKAADWPAVARGTEALLLTRSKDLRLAAWWAEAQASLRGWRGLADGLLLAEGLVRQHWDGLHPRADGTDREQRIGALAWLLARVAALASTAAPQADGAADWPMQIADCAAARSALSALERAVDARLGADGPGFRAAADALDRAGDALQRLAREARPQHVAADAAPAADVQALPAPSAPLAPAAGAPRNREEAVQRLRELADWFRRAEPHSPAGYLAERAAQWAELPLHAWLRVVLKDGSALTHVEELLGLGAAAARPVD